MMNYINMAGLDALRARIEAAAAAVPAMLSERVINTGVDLVEQLSMASPASANLGPAKAVPGDAEGKLMESFDWTMLGTGSTLLVGQIVTDQPNKLKFVRYGTGIYGPLGQRIYPRTARALYWLGAAHPYHSVAGQQPYDFVSPILLGAEMHVHTEMSIMQEEFINLLRL